MSKPFDPLQARIELLQMKAELQRMELRQELAAVRANSGWFNASRQFAGWLSARQFAKLSPLMAAGMQVWQQGLKQYPILGFLASTALLRFKKPLAGHALRAGLAAVVLAGAMFWFRQRR